MKISNITIEIIFLGIPGIICYFVLSKLIGKCGKNNVESFLLIFLFSILSYLFYGLFWQIYDSFSLKVQSTNTFKFIYFSKDKITPSVILGAAFTSIVLAFTLSYFYTYNLLNRFAQTIKASNKFGDEDVWHYFHNAPLKQKNDGWIYIRDHRLNLLYYGSITTWSESEKAREILISNVSVYNNDDGKELYTCDHLYICRDKYDITIEVPSTNKNNAAEPT